MCVDPKHRPEKTQYKHEACDVFLSVYKKITYHSSPPSIAEKDRFSFVTNFIFGVFSTFSPSNFYLTKAKVLISPNSDIASSSSDQKALHIRRHKASVYIFMYYCVF